MNFQVKDISFTIDLNNIQEGNLGYRVINEWSEEIAKLRSYDIPEIYDYLSFDIEVIRGWKRKVEFKKVKTSGPILGFMGIYLDLPSGYIILGKQKKKEFIALFNYYEYLKRECGVDISPKAMMSLVESFKMGEKDLFDLIGTIKDEDISGINSDLSLISILLQLEEKELNSKSNIDINRQDFYKPIFEAANLLRKILDKNLKVYSAKEESNDKVNQMRIDLVNQTGDSDILEFIDSMKSSGKHMKTLNNVWNLKREGKLKYEDWNTALRGLCAMPYTESYTDITDLTKTEVSILNIRDVVEEFEGDSLLELDDLLMTKDENIDKKVLNKVIDKIGVREYFSGASLSYHVSKKIKYFSKDLLYIIDKAMKDKNNLTSYVLLNKEMEVIVSGFKRNIRFFRNALQLASKVIR